MIKIIHRWVQLWTDFTSISVTFIFISQMNDNYNGMMNESPNRQSPTNRSSTPSRTNTRSINNNMNHMNHQSSNNHPTSIESGSPHSPLSNDSMLACGTNFDNMNCEGLRHNLLMGSSTLDGALLNGMGSANGINDIMLSGLGSDSNSKLIASGSVSLSTSHVIQTSPSHQLSITQTTTSIPEIVFSGEFLFFCLILLLKERKLNWIIFFRLLIRIWIQSWLPPWQLSRARHNRNSDVWECQHHWSNDWR